MILYVQEANVGSRTAGIVPLGIPIIFLDVKSSFGTQNSEVRRELWGGKEPPNLDYKDFGPEWVNMSARESRKRRGNNQSPVCKRGV